MTSTVRPSSPLQLVASIRVKAAMMTAHDAKSILSISRRLQGAQLLCGADRAFDVAEIHHAI